LVSGLATNDEASDFHWATEAEVPGLMTVAPLSFAPCRSLDSGLPPQDLAPAGGRRDGASSEAGT